MRRNVLSLAVVGACVALLVFLSRAYLPFFPDDGFISLRYSKRFAHGHGLTWTDGEPVEGYSNLLWVALMAGVELFAPDLVLAARVVGTCSIGAALAALAFAHRPSRLSQVLPALAGGLAMVLTCEMQAWAIGGLEQALMAALLAAATASAYGLVDAEAPALSRASVVGVLLGLATLTRPDGVLFAGTTATALLLARRDKASLQAILRVIVIAASFALAQVAFRRVYYHAWVPNTAHAKLAFNRLRLQEGWDYLKGSEPYLHSLLIPTVCSVAIATIDKRQRKRMLVPLSGLVVWCGYVCLIGGDIFPARRHLVVPIVFASMIVALGVESMIHGGRVASVAAWCVAPFVLFDLYAAQTLDPARDHALRDTWQWSGRPVGRFLSRAFDTLQPLVAVDAAGSLPYFAINLPCLDMLGLSDRYLGEHPPPGFGQGVLGHELGDGRYVLRRKPDIIDFWTPLGGDQDPWRSGSELKATDEFARLYQGVNFQTEPPEVVQTRLWVRREDGRIGVLRSDSRVTIPGYLFAANSDSIAEFDAGSRVGLRIAPAEVALFSRLHLAGGLWQVRVEASNGLIARVFDTGRSSFASPEGQTTFDLSEASDVDLQIQSTSPSPEHLYRVDLVRQ